MRRAASLVAVILALAGCGGGEEIPFEGVERMARGACFPTREGFVVRSARELGWLLARPRCDGPVPSVDFSREMLVIYASGMRGGGSHEVRVTRVDRGEDGALVAHVTVRGPGPGCMVSANVTYPRVVIRTARVDGPVRFAVRTRVRDCLPWF